MIEQWFSCSEEIFSCKIFALYNDGEMYVCQTLPTYRPEEARLNFLIFLTFVWLGNGRLDVARGKNIVDKY